MDPGPPLGCSLKDVKWSAVSVPLDLLVSTYRLPQIARLDSGAWGGGRAGGSARRRAGSAGRTGAGLRGGRRAAGAAPGAGCRAPGCTPFPPAAGGSRRAVRSVHRRPPSPGVGAGLRLASESVRWFASKYLGSIPTRPRTVCVQGAR